jgi:hypothetical protein
MQVSVGTDAMSPPSINRSALPSKSLCLRERDKSVSTYNQGRQLLHFIQGPGCGRIEVTFEIALNLVLIT